MVTAIVAWLGSLDSSESGFCSALNAVSQLVLFKSSRCFKSHLRFMVAIRSTHVYSSLFSVAFLLPITEIIADS